MATNLDRGLTGREREIASLIRDGLTDRQIADRLFISRRTAEWHVKQILNKLGFNSRAQVAAWMASEDRSGKIADTRRPRHNLPVQLTTFVGRLAQLNEVERLLATYRLVTLTAVAGAGKTRLALEAAARLVDAYRDGVRFVDLAPIQEAHLVSRAFGSAVGVYERPRQPLTETLIDRLNDRRMLLVVDNCEHVAAACAELIGKMLSACPEISVLATSREPLRIGGEAILRIAPLTTPDAFKVIDADELERCEAVALFVDRAHLASSAFAVLPENANAIAELCRRLDGIPLAIELAAARAGSMSVDQLLERLQHRFNLLTVGSRPGPARHRTLESAVDWSYDLLASEERCLFRRLSVFNGTFSLEAAEETCGIDDVTEERVAGFLGGLVDRSLVFAAADGSATMRFRVLETLRDYARMRLEDAGERDLLDRRHCEFFVRLAEHAAPNLEGAEERAWHQRLANEIGNLRSAMQWSAQREYEANLRLSTALAFFWYTHGLVQEGDGYVKASLSNYLNRDVLRARALELSGQFSYWRNDLDGAAAAWYEAFDIYGELGHARVVDGLRWIGEVTEWRGNDQEAREYFEIGLTMARQVNDTILAAHFLRHLCRLAIKAGEHQQARDHGEQGLLIFEEVGDRVRVNWALGYLGLNAVESGDFAAAGHHLERALTIARELDLTVPIATSLMYFATLAAAQSKPATALQLASAAEAIAASAGAVPMRLTRRIVERWLEKSRVELGAERSAACLAEGCAMSIEEAIELALEP